MRQRQSARCVPAPPLHPPAKSVLLPWLQGDARGDVGAGEAVRQISRQLHVAGAKEGCTGALCG